MLGGSAGRRAHLRSPHRSAAGQQRGRHDRGLDPPALRRAGAHLQPDHQLRAGGQPGGARLHEQAPGHHRVGVTGESER